MRDKKREIEAEVDVMVKNVRGREDKGGFSPSIIRTLL